MEVRSWETGLSRCTATRLHMSQLWHGLSVSNIGQEHFIFSNRNGMVLGLFSNAWSTQLS